MSNLGILNRNFHQAMPYMIFCLRYLLVLLLLIVFGGCSSTQPKSDSQENEFSLELAVDFYEAGIRSIEDRDWISAEAHLEHAVEILAKISPDNGVVNDSVQIQSLSKDSLEFFIEELEVYERPKDTLKAKRLEQLKNSLKAIN